jgi:hypothetical protein
LIVETHRTQLKTNVKTDYILDALADLDSRMPDSNGNPTVYMYMWEISHHAKQKILEKAGSMETCGHYPEEQD